MEEMRKKIIRCVMCGNIAQYIDEKTKEPLCKKCAIENEGIKRNKIN